MEAKDVMIPISNFIRPDDTIKEALNLLCEVYKDAGNQYLKGLPVLDSDQRLVGIFSEGEVLKAVYPFYMSMANLGMFSWNGMLESLAMQAGDQAVADHMLRDFPVIHPHTPLMTCIDWFMKKEINLMPVTDEAQHVLGIVYPQNVINVITEVILAAEQRDRSLLPRKSPVLAPYEHDKALLIPRASAQYL